MKVQSLRSLREEMRAVARRTRKAPADAAAPSVESAEALLRLLSPDNRALLALIASKHPKSMAELAKLAGRAESNLSRTLAKFQAMGIVRLEQGEGLAKVPRLVVRKLRLDIDVCDRHDRIVAQEG